MYCERPSHLCSVSASQGNTSINVTIVTQAPIHPRSRRASNTTTPNTSLPSPSSRPQSAAGSRRVSLSASSPAAAVGTLRRPQSAHTITPFRQSDMKIASPPSVASNEQPFTARLSLPASVDASAPSAPVSPLFLLARDNEVVPSSSSRALSRQSSLTSVVRPMSSRVARLSAGLCRVLLFTTKSIVFTCRLLPNVSRQQNSTGAG